MTTLEELNRLKEEGYLFHGSRKHFKTIIPNKKEKLHISVGRYKAVYATDHPLVAMFFACVHPEKLPLINGKIKCLKGYRFNVDEHPYFAFTPNIYKYNAFSNGYIYIVDRNDFRSLKKLNHEYYSFKKVKPKLVLTVQPEEFLHEAKHMIYPVEAVRLAKFHTDEEIIAMGYE